MEATVIRRVDGRKVEEPVELPALMEELDSIKRGEKPGVSLGIRLPTGAGKSVKASAKFLKSREGRAFMQDIGDLATLSGIGIDIKPPTIVSEPQSLVDTAEIWGIDRGVMFTKANEPHNIENWGIYTVPSLGRGGRRRVLPADTVNRISQNLAETIPVAELYLAIRSSGINIGLGTFYNLLKHPQLYFREGVYERQYGEKGLQLVPGILERGSRYMRMDYRDAAKLVRELQEQRRIDDYWYQPDDIAEMIGLVKADSVNIIASGMGIKPVVIRWGGTKHYRYSPEDGDRIVRSRTVPDERHIPLKAVEFLAMTKEQQEEELSSRGLTLEQWKETLKPTLIDRPLSMTDTAKFWGVGITALMKRLDDPKTRREWKVRKEGKEWEFPPETLNRVNLTIKSTIHLGDAYRALSDNGIEMSDRIFYQICKSPRDYFDAEDYQRLFGTQEDITVPIPFGGGTDSPRGLTFENFASLARGLREQQTMLKEWDSISTLAAKFGTSVGTARRAILDAGIKYKAIRWGTPLSWRFPPQEVEKALALKVRMSTERVPDERDAVEKVADYLAADQLGRQRILSETGMSHEEYMESIEPTTVDRPLSIPGAFKLWGISRAGMYRRIDDPALRQEWGVEMVGGQWHVPAETVNRINRELKTLIPQSVAYRALSDNGLELDDSVFYMLCRNPREFMGEEEYGRVFGDQESITVPSPLERYHRSPRSFTFEDFEKLAGWLRQEHKKYVEWDSTYTLAQKMHVSVDTVQYYVRADRLKPSKINWPASPPNLYRFPPDESERVLKINRRIERWDSAEDLAEKLGYGRGENARNAVYRMVQRGEVKPTTLWKRHGITMRFSPGETKRIMREHGLLPERPLREVVAADVEKEAAESGFVLDSHFRDYLREAGSFKRLSQAEELDYLKRARGGDNEARERLVNSHRALLATVAWGFHKKTGYPVMDLIQEGLIGLLSAIELYDPDKTNPKTGLPFRFGTYAHHRMASQIQHMLRDRGRIVRQPAWVQETMSRVNKISAALTMELGREPTTEEMAAELGMDTRKFERLLSRTQPVDSIDVKYDEDEGDTIAESIASQQRIDEEVEGRLLKGMIGKALDAAKLKDKERMALDIRYGMGEYEYPRTTTEVARIMGISVNYAAYLEHKALDRIRNSRHPDVLALRDFFEEGG